MTPGTEIQEILNPTGRSIYQNDFSGSSRLWILFVTYQRAPLVAES